jgi:hypothetical protein
MSDQARCPRRRHANPPENRFCGSCGASLGAGSDLVARRRGNLTVMGRVLPTIAEARRQRGRRGVGGVGLAGRAEHPQSLAQGGVEALEGPVDAPLF